MSLLEAKLRERLNKSPWPEARNPLTLRSLLSVATNQEVLNPALSDSLHKWMRLRNEVVHSSKDVSRAQADRASSMACLGYFTLCRSTWSRAKIPHAVACVNDLSVDSKFSHRRRHIHSWM